MTIEELFKEKELKPKAKTETLARWILEKELAVDELIHFAKTAKDPIKASCIEALEFASTQSLSVIDAATFCFITQSLSEKSPRIKWESAKIIAKTAFLFPDKLDEVIPLLLLHARHEGTVVRWSAASALVEIALIRKELKPKLIELYHQEEKNSIKNSYQKAWK